MLTIYHKTFFEIPSMLVVFLLVKFFVLGIIIYRSLKRNKKIKNIKINELKFRSIFHHAPLAMVLTDDKYIIHNANSEFVKLTGFHANQSSYLLDYIPAKEHSRYIICSSSIQKIKFRHQIKTPTGIYLNCLIQTSLLDENQKLFTFSPEHFNQRTSNHPYPASFKETGK
jgi:PAS domain-containing protein